MDDLQRFRLQECINSLRVENERLTSIMYGDISNNIFDFIGEVGKIIFEMEELLEEEDDVF